MLAKPEVTSVDVVEIDADVIQLIQKHFQADLDKDRLRLYWVDALEKIWERGRRWDVVWHDIWDGISTDNIPDMQKLKRKYGSRAEWQGCWCEALCYREREWNR